MLPGLAFLTHIHPVAFRTWRSLPSRKMCAFQSGFAYFTNFDQVGLEIFRVPGSMGLWVYFMLDLCIWDVASLGLHRAGSGVYWVDVTSAGLFQGWESRALGFMGLFLPEVYWLKQCAGNSE